MSVKAVTDPALDTVLKDKSPRTRANYASALSRAVTITAARDLKTMMMGRARSHAKLAEFYPKPSSLKTILAIICSVITANPGLIPEGCAHYWRERMGDAKASNAELAANNVVSPQLLKKWIEYDAIQSKLEELLETVGHTDMRTSQDLVLLAMYAFLPPKRADLGKLRIVKAAKDIKADENGLVLPDRGNGLLVLNCYKTAKVYGRFEEALPSELTAVIRASLAAHPRPYLVCGPRGKPLSDGNYGSRVSSVMDRHLGKALSVNDLRHLYITQRVQLHKVTHAERAEIAHSMMHSSDVQLEYIRTM